MARTPSDSATPASGRVAQMRQVWSMTRQADPRLPLVVFLPALAVLAVVVVVGVLIGHPIYLTVLGILAAVMVGTVIFGRRASAMMFSQVEGRPGAAAAVLQGMRGDWRVTPAVAFNRNQDLVHRVVGRPGIILVGEAGLSGGGAALKTLITDQKRRVGRVAPETPMHDLVVGDAEGQIPLRQLQRHMLKLPRSLAKADVAAVDARMKALGGANVPLPKGPLPRSGRMPRGKMR